MNLLKRSILPLLAIAVFIIAISESHSHSSTAPDPSLSKASETCRSYGSVVHAIAQAREDGEDILDWISPEVEDWNVLIVTVWLNPQPPHEQYLDFYLKCMWGIGFEQDT